MKPVQRDNTFEKHYRQRIGRNSKLVLKFKERLALFITDREHHQLRDHALTGELKGQRAFSITGDIRVIYVEFEDRIVLLDIGTHAQVYGM